MNLFNNTLISFTPLLELKFVLLRVNVAVNNCETTKTTTIVNIAAQIGLRCTLRIARLRGTMALMVTTVYLALHSFYYFFF